VDLEQRVAELEARLRTMEDHVAILNLLAAYGPAVDAGASGAAARLWTEDGVYDVGAMARVQGWAALAELYDAELHQSLIHRGSAHVTTLPRITVDGDTATAVAHSLVVLRNEDGGGYTVWRASANHWTLARTAAGWRILERYNRVLDGSPESHQTLRRD
jgi:ketosteroid isomerase-like protein